MERVTVRCSVGGDVTTDRVLALRQERAGVLALCRDLDDAEWQMPSAAPGWRVQDVVAHMGSGCHAFFGGPGALEIMRSKDIEHANDMLVDQRQEWPASRILAEYERWSRRFIGVFGPLSRTPLGRVRMPLAELGRFPLTQFLSALVFDTHTHLRHDIAPALGRPAPGTDANRMAVVLEWMLAVLNNQLRAARPVWLDRPVSITLSGDGGGRWVVRPDGSIIPGSCDGATTQIAGLAIDFPGWGTQRVGWRERDVTIGGDTEYGTRFLDAVNVV
jgi:uncharacterized protein (TIGR03083 family)